jgi:hypothetical protein
MTIKHALSIAALSGLAFSYSVLLQAQSVWVADSLQRVGMVDPAGATTSIALYAAKGESESFQVIIHAPASGVTITNLTASDLTGPGGAMISQQNFTFYREYYVNSTSPSPNVGGTNQPLGAGWYPDALIPFKDPSTGQTLSGGTYQAVPYALAANKNQPFWIDINVPVTAASGNYSGTVTMSTSIGTSTIPVTLQVWNFTLPTAPRLKSSFGYHGTWGTLANNEVLLANRVTPFIVPANQVSSLKPYGAQITGLNYFNLSDGCTIYAPPTVAAVASSVSQFPSLSTYVYVADEVTGCPNVAQNLSAWAQVAHAAGTKTLVTVVPEAALMDDGSGTGKTDVDIWTILPKQYTAALPQLPTLFAKGNELWSYNAMVQDNYSPKWEIDFAPMNYRIFPGFINQEFGFTGMLYAGVALWTSDPWNNVNTYQIAGNNYPGEDLLVYPGQQVGMSTSSVVPSMRLKFLRDGFDDYDYIAMLKDQGESVFADSIVNGIVPDWTNWTKNTSTLFDARFQIGQELDRIGNAATPILSPAGGQYFTNQTVTMSTAGTYSIRYTTDGSAPSSTTGMLYTGSIAVNSTMTIQAIAYQSGWNDSAISSASYSIVPMQPPSNPWPASATSSVATSSALQCNAVTGATQYQIYMGTNPSSLSLFSTNTATGNVVLQPVYNLAPGATYYWQVVAINSATSTSSPIWSFTTVAPIVVPAPPSNAWPASGSSSVATSLTLQCSAATGATQYQIYMGTNSSSLSLLSTAVATGNVVRQAVYNLAPGTTYYWNVIAINGASSTSSPIWSFTTVAPVVVLAPASNAWPTSGASSVATSLTLQCNAVTGAAQYQIYMGTNSSSMSLIATDVATGSVVRQAVYNLAHGTTYYWKVVAINGAASTSSLIWSFTTN